MSAPWRAGGAVVAWRDERRGFDIGFFAQAVSREGRTSWDEGGAVVCEGSGDREMLRVRSDDRKGVYFAWLDFGLGYKLFAQHLVESGDPGRGWEENGTLVSHTAEPWEYVSGYRTLDLVAGVRGNAIVGWSDARVGTLGMLLTPRGPASAIVKAKEQATPATITVGPVAAGPVFALHSVSPNPVVAEAVLRFALPEATHATLEMIDVAGRRVWSREVGDLGAGEHTVSLAADARLPHGMYFVRLRQGARVAMLGVAVLR